MPSAKNLKSQANKNAETEFEAESTAEPASAPAIASETASDPVLPPQSDPRRRNSQTSWKQVYCAIVLGVLVGVALDSMSGANTIHKSKVFPSAYAMQSLKQIRRSIEHTAPQTCVNSRHITRKPTDRSSQDKTEPTSDWLRFVVPKMNQNVMPCEDFYNYACGTLINNTEIPDGKQMVNAFTELTDLLQNQLLSLVKEKIDKNNTKVFTLPKVLYQRCMDKSSIEKQGITRLLDIFKKLGGWPVLEGDIWNDNLSWTWENMLKNLRRLGYSTNYFFDVSVRVDSKNTSRRIIYIDQPTLSIKSEYLSMGLTKARVYFNYTIDMALLLGAEEERAKQNLLDSLHFEMALARNSLPNEERQNATALYHPMSMKEFQSNYPYANWLNVLNDIFLDTNIVIDEDEIIIVQNPRFMEKLGKLLLHSLKRSVSNYVMQRVINFSASFLPEALLKLQLKYSAELCDKSEHTCLDIATESLPSSVEPLFSRKYFDNVISFSSYFLTEKLTPQYSTVYGTAHEQEHRCLDVTTNRLPIAVGALYIRKYFNDASRRAVLDMANEIKSAFGEILKTVDWMDDFTRQSALEKLESMVLYIGYPDELMNVKNVNEYYKNLVFLLEDSYLNTTLRINRFTTNINLEKLRQPVNKTDWTTHSNQTGVDGFYSPTENNIHIPASYLQGQLFSIDRPKYMNYGAIGSVIGRAITRGFYDQGRQFDKSGNPVNWWQIDTEEAFEEMTTCLREQFDNYTEPNLNLKLSGNNTFVHNMADNGGIKAAYNAYKKWAENNGPEPRLPGSHLTPEQMFWLSVAQSWYSVYQPKGVWTHVAANDISPAQFRVLVSMSNMIEFSKDFKCSYGSPMNPPRKCQVW